MKVLFPVMAADVMSVPILALIIMQNVQEQEKFLNLKLMETVMKMIIPVLML